MCHDSSNNQEWGLANDLLPDHLGRTLHHRGAATGGILLGRDRAAPGAPPEHHLERGQGGTAHLVMDATGRARPSRERTDDARGLAGTSTSQRQTLALVEKKLKADWSPEQISGHLRLHGELSISHETIYTHRLAGQGGRRTSIPPPSMLAQT